VEKRNGLRRTLQSYAGFRSRGSGVLRPEQARRLLSSSILVGVIFPSEKGRLRVDSNTRSKLSIFGQRIVCQHAFEALNMVLPRTPRRLGPSLNFIRASVSATVTASKSRQCRSLVAGVSRKT
jgi:hypothetical protein